MSQNNTLGSGIGQHYQGTTTAGNTIYVSPNQGIVQGIGTITSNHWNPYYTGTISSPSATIKYRTLKLPRSSCPQQVFFNGRLLTLGIIGTNVECAFTGTHLVFENMDATVMFQNRTTVIIRYKDSTYNYNIDKFKSDTELNAELVSTLEH